MRELVGEIVRSTVRPPRRSGLCETYPTLLNQSRTTEAIDVSDARDVFCLTILDRSLVPCQRVSLAKGTAARIFWQGAFQRQRPHPSLLWKRAFRRATDFLGERFLRGRLSAAETRPREDEYDGQWTPISMACDGRPGMSSAELRDGYFHDTSLKEVR